MSIQLRHSDEPDPVGSRATCCLEWRHAFPIITLLKLWIIITTTTMYSLNERSPPSSQYSEEKNPTVRKTHANLGKLTKAPGVLH